jgi:hypothetical protein
MNDAKLLEFGSAAKDMCSPDAKTRQSSLGHDSWVQVEEAKPEWRHRQRVIHITDILILRRSIDITVVVRADVLRIFFPYC